MSNLKQLLDSEVEKRNSFLEINEKKLDPIIVAREHKDEYISLICALFAYGNVNAIVKFLRSLDFTLLNEKEETIKKELSSHYYRFQNSTDVIEFFITLRRLKQQNSLEAIFLQNYKKDNNFLFALFSLLQTIIEINPHTSQGYSFLLGKPYSTSPYKRWMMYLRWMIRKDEIDMGLWSGIDKKELIIPLDTHTFKVSQKLGLLKRKSYDLKAALELTERLREFDKTDPVKYDFAIYRLGQEKIV